MDRRYNPIGSAGPRPVVLRQYFMLESVLEASAILKAFGIRHEHSKVSRAIVTEPYVEWTYEVRVARADRKQAERVLRSQGR